MMLRKYRCVFTSKEDQMMEGLVEQFGTNDWESVARLIPGRSPRQCRERWFTYVAPEVNRMPWSCEEDALLFDLVQTHGPKWGSLASFFCNRTQNNVKNRWNTVIRKAKALGLDPVDRKCFIQTGTKIACRATRPSFEGAEQTALPSPQQLYSLGNLLNSTMGQ
jgi:hypothetical protein